MGVPTPVIPSFVDGTVVHQADLNALASNLTNLYAYNQGGFRTQRPCVIAQSTSTQSIAASTDTLVSFGSATVNTNSMWVGGSPTQITIQTAGIYWIFAQVRWPAVAGATLGNAVFAHILANGTTTANAIACQNLPMLNTTPGTTNQVGVIANLAANATLYLSVWQNTSGAMSTQTDRGGCYLGAVFLTPST